MPIASYFIALFEKGSLLMNDTNDTDVRLIENVDIRPYLYVFWHWAWLIVLVGVLTGGISFLISTRITPVYQASTQLLVSQPPSASAGISGVGTIVSGQLATRTYVEMLTNRPVLEQTIALLKIPISVNDLEKAVRVSLVQNTQLLNLTVEDTSRSRAAKIANTLGEVFTQRIQELESSRYSVSKKNLQDQIAQMENLIDETTGSFNATIDQSERDRLETKLTQYRTIYSSLVTSYEQVRLAEAQTNTTVVQVDPAVTPISPVRPKPLQNGLLAAVVGILLSMGVIFAMTALDDTLKDPEELARQTGLTIIGVIPHDETASRGLVTQLEPRSPVSEAYRSLRTNIEYANAAHPLTRIVITSATPSDGKSTIAANLATVIAQGEKGISLLDADMRRPRVHSLMNLSQRSGLSELFLQNTLVLNGQHQHTNIHNLRVISAGKTPPNPADLLGSNRMKEVLDAAQKESDVLIIDSPPVLSVTDAAVLSPLVDGFILVVKAGATQSSAIKQAVVQLRQIGANLIGLVVNDVRFDNSNYSYYYRSRYYSYYYQNPSDSEKVRKKKFWIFPWGKKKSYPSAPQKAGRHGKHSKHSNSKTMPTDSKNH
jgi:non-specific protein-tyrosine kinase